MHMVPFYFYFYFANGNVNLSTWQIDLLGHLQEETLFEPPDLPDPGSTQTFLSRPAWNKPEEASEEQVYVLPTPKGVGTWCFRM